MKPNNTVLVIIDTSAFIETYQNPTSPLTKNVQSLIEVGLASITPLIQWEICRGKMTKKERAALLEYLDNLTLLEWKINWKDLEGFDLSLRQAGIIVPFTDLWIARVAIEWGAFILHQDKHFNLISSHSSLRIWNPS